MQYTLLRRSIYLPFRHKRVVRKAEAALSSQVRASTIANLSNVRSFEPNQGILSFTGGISCCCSRSYRHDVSDYFRRHPRHVHGKGIWRKGDPGDGKASGREIRQRKDYPKHIRRTLYAEHIKRAEFSHTSALSFHIYL